MDEEKKEESDNFAVALFVIAVIIGIIFYYVFFVREARNSCLSDYNDFPISLIPVRCLKYFRFPFF